jgi:hypothetical protein
MQDKDHKQIEETIQALYQSFENGDVELFKSVTHPQARTVNIGNSNQAFVFSLEEIINNTILGLRNAKEQIPGFFANWVNIYIKTVQTHDQIASAEVTYTMEMPESYGEHTSFIQLLKDGARWLIIQIIDRGLEINK